MSQFMFSSGIVIGADHVATKKNCQDALKMLQKPEFLVAFVADGCGDAIYSPYSEMGSRQGVTTAVNYVAAKLETTSKWRWNSTLQSTGFWGDVQRHSLEKMDDAARGMGGNYKQVVISHFLFTLVGMVVTPDITLFVSLGDGYYFLNGEMYEVRPNPVDNMPPYLAFNLVETSLRKMSPEELKLSVKKVVPTRSVESVMISTDGLGGILSDSKKRVPGTNTEVGGPEQFWNEKDYFDNTFSLGWRLNQLATEKKIIKWDEKRAEVHPAIITDDLALVVGRRY
ncbi:MAG: hypothetical protein UW41_C0001G0046 [Candidatus Collierbacteria bacterium GW2011_GWC2_44_18]|uniref:PPM-type phosphatase domain-containing protein n=2 Tax=Microgenomates group TaxID=1794810 RepID=A0A0G1J7Q4_9BACT|nr:MAG: hypothetical protein UW41_C0001G0046 [Candidatus Collierbacteria bacterium GW2011_GWC2_44_18]KKT67651.1 MAG: hypothetical protein UW60_C0002G0003 [Candidatus Woesebacteria bacterium GW2011_GWA2_44_33]